jgi:putative ABC transport system substrate-binding protein
MSLIVWLLALVGAVLGLLVSPLAAGAQAPGKIHRIGWLSVAARTPEVSHLIDAFTEGLRALGYVEGRNIAIEYRFADNNAERLPAFAAELVGLKVDVFLAPNPTAVRAAEHATRTIPIVMLGVADPVGSGVIASLARPGGNITGLSASSGTSGPEMIGKLVELLRELAPKASRVAVLRNPTNPDAAPISREVERAARALGVQLRVLDVRHPGEIDGAFATMARDRSGALLVMPDTMFLRQRARIASLAVKGRLPTVSGAREMAEAGILMTYGRSLPYEFSRAAAYVDKVLKGVRPADLPVEQPTKFDLVINTKTARALGLTVPPPLLARADQIIE